MELTAGSTVTIKVMNPIWPMRKAYASYMHIPEFNEYTGTVIRKHKAVKDGQIGLTTGEQPFDMRVIDIDRIVGMGDAPTGTAAPSVRVWEVKGSKGNVYTVTDDGRHRECTCPGFTHRRDCKHIREEPAC